MFCAWDFSQSGNPETVFVSYFGRVFWWMSALIMPAPRASSFQYKQASNYTSEMTGVLRKRPPSCVRSHPLFAWVAGSLCASLWACGCVGEMGCVNASRFSFCASSFECLAMCVCVITFLQNVNSFPWCEVPETDSFVTEREALRSGGLSPAPSPLGWVGERTSLACQCCVTDIFRSPTLPGGLGLGGGRVRCVCVEGMRKTNQEKREIGKTGGDGKHLLSIHSRGITFDVTLAHTQTRSFSSRLEKGLSFLQAAQHLLRAYMQIGCKGFFLNQLRMNGETLVTVCYLASTQMVSPCIKVMML